MKVPKTDITVNLGDLSGPDGNAFCILGKVRGALKQHGYKDLVEEYTEQATSGNYDHLLQVTRNYVEVL